MQIRDASTMAEGLSFSELSGVFGICQHRHWTAVAIDWRQGTIQHYNPLMGPSKRAKGIHNVSPLLRTVFLHELKLCLGGREMDPTS